MHLIIFQRVSSVQEFEAADPENETEMSKERSKKMQKIGYQGDNAIEADEVRRPWNRAEFGHDCAVCFYMVSDVS